MPLDITVWHPRSSPDLSFYSYESLKTYLILSGEINSDDDSVLYNVSWIPQLPDPEVLEWDKK